MGREGKAINGHKCGVFLAFDARGSRQTAETRLRIRGRFGRSDWAHRVAKAQAMWAANPARSA